MLLSERKIEWECLFESCECVSERWRPLSDKKVQSASLFDNYERRMV